MFSQKLKQKKEKRKGEQDREREVIRNIIIFSEFYP